LPADCGKKFSGTSPRLLQIASMRRGFTAPAFSLAKAGVIASSIGNERAMPAPRKKLRRDNAR